MAYQIVAKRVDGETGPTLTVHRTVLSLNNEAKNLLEKMVLGAPVEGVEVFYDKKEKRTRSIEEFDPKTVDALSTLRGVIRIYTLDDFSGTVKKAYDEYKKSLE